MESLQVIYLVVVPVEQIVQLVELLLQMVVEVKEPMIIQVQLEVHAEQLMVKQV
jgi:hypothetical protein